MLAHDILERIKEKRPTILAVGNIVSAEAIRMAVTSLGGKCYVSFNTNEAADIAERVDAVMIDTSGIDDGRIAASIAAARVANRRRIPVVVDLNRIDASLFRVASLLKILQEVHVSMIRGNMTDYWAMVQRYQEIKDMKKINNLENMAKTLKWISLELQTTVVLSDRECLITDGDYYAHVSNYHPLLEFTPTSEVILSSVIALMLSLEGYDPITKAIMACGVVTVAAEFVGEKHPEVGPGSAQMRLLDEMFHLTSRDLLKYMDLIEE